MKRIIAIGLLLTAIAGIAQETEGLIVTSNGNEHQFAISNVREITYADEAMTIVTNDGEWVEIPAQWQIRFGEVGSNGTSSIDVSVSDGIVQVFDTEGRLIKEDKMSDIFSGDMPKGIYIIKYNGTNLKIRR